MDLISYGDSIPEGEYRLHSAFANALNFRRGKVIVSLVPPRAGAGPLNLVVKQVPPGARRLRATRLYFYVDENRLRKDPAARYSSAIPELRPEPAAVLANAGRLARLLAEVAPEKSLAFVFDAGLEKAFSRTFERRLLARFKKAVAAFRAGNWRAGAGTMRGLGFGLTPSGDDFLAGMLTGLNYAALNLGADVSAAVERIYFGAVGRNLISNNFLEAAYEGRVNAKTRRLLTALSAPGGRGLGAAAGAALDSGHTSGADFCSGLAFALLETLSHKENL